MVVVVWERHVQCGSGNVASRLTSCFLASITLHQDVTSFSYCIQIPDTLFFPLRIKWIQCAITYRTAKHGQMLMAALCANTPKIIGMRRTSWEGVRIFSFSFFTCALRKVGCNLN